MGGYGAARESAAGTVSILPIGIAHAPGLNGPAGGQEQKEE